MPSHSQFFMKCLFIVFFLISGRIRETCCPKRGTRLSLFLVEVSSIFVRIFCCSIFASRLVFLSHHGNQHTVK